MSLGVYEVWSRSFKILVFWTNSFIYFMSQTLVQFHCRVYDIHKHIHVMILIFKVSQTEKNQRLSEYDVTDPNHIYCHIHTQMRNLL